MLLSPSHENCGSFVNGNSQNVATTGDLCVAGDTGALIYKFYIAVQFPRMSTCLIRLFPGNGLTENTRQRNNFYIQSVISFYLLLIIECQQSYNSLL